MQMEPALAATIPDGAVNDSLLTDLKRSVRSALEVIENLLLAAMEDKDVAAMRHRRMLLYQTRQ